MRDLAFLSLVGDRKLREALDDYLLKEFRKEAGDEVERMVLSYGQNEAILKKRFLNRLEFGTAGLRGPMHLSGNNAMNMLTVLQTSQGIATYLFQRCGGVIPRGRPIFVGYDARHNSREFAEYAAAAFAVTGFETHLFESHTPTPYTPFAVKAYGGLFGVQITASHNPKEDNGYKVYDDNAAQIIPPVDRNIASTIVTRLIPQPPVLALKKQGEPIGTHKNLVTNSLPKIKEDYMKVIASTCFEESCQQSDVVVVYTALHGVGSEAVQEVVKRAGFNMDNFYLVEQQDKPDPEFPTVVFPNPEEDGALDLAMKRADEVSASLVFANDPDADRFALCERLPDGSWYRFHGDEIGTLVGYLMMERKAKMGIPYSKQVFVSSTVSSKMLKAIVESYGCKYIDTMTGFKWIMNEGIKQECSGLSFTMGYEEALGYAISMGVPDKDGISTSGMMIQEACKLYDAGRTFGGLLEQLRKKHGYFVTNNNYKKCHDKAAINQMFTEFRNNGKYLPTLGGSNVLRVRDVTTGYDNGEENKRCKFPTTPEANMVTLYLENGAVCTLRTSGTEPKIKWYCEMSSSDPEDCRKQLAVIVQDIITNIMKPDVYPVE